MDLRRLTVSSILLSWLPCFDSHSWNSPGAISGCRRAGSQTLGASSGSMLNSSGNCAAMAPRLSSPTASSSSFSQWSEVAVAVVVAMLEEEEAEGAVAIAIAIAAGAGAGAANCFRSPTERRRPGMAVG
ncbi:hypothetical protein BX661DRAFT_180522 [Kickxella alabastrina]|uniref:uncharacterized protein n=1 Tax=Kickxella alabastrina TaxID=61397 RepID=UPI002220606E|nr:uncharacterized protein BX661DRAFT_180522 [Kickxella alabastrina]KAI7831033.1 hypothetical protein BX661DRAFT_180522 [Kickxella alabastrina]